MSIYVAEQKPKNGWTPERRAALAARNKGNKHNRGKHGGRTKGLRVRPTP